MLYGYAGKMLRVDLSTGMVKTEKLDSDFALRTIGGRGMNSRRLFLELKKDVDPLSPENLLILGVGPLTGSYLTASAYFTFTAKSPLTGILGDSSAGGHFGPELKQAGYDQVILTGRSERPCYLLISREKIELRDASSLWGKDIWETSSAIRKMLKDPSVQIAAIGPAGEHLVKYATIACNNSRMCGRTGMGCVMGSKNIKAIAVKGSGPVTLADPLRFLDLCKTIDRKILAHPEFEKRKHLGTTMLMTDLNRIGILPTRHFQEGIFKDVEKVSGETLAQKFKVKNKSCFNCNVHCSRYYVTGEAEGEGPEFETLCSYSSRLGVNDLDFTLKANAFLNRMGMDSISSGEAIGWAIECIEKGLLNKEDFDGLDLRWGNTEAIEKLLTMIATRQGIGDAFAEGTRSLAERFGKGTEEYAFHVKGLDMICGDPRGIKAYGLTYAISSRGGDHLRAEPFFELTERYEEAKKRFGTREAANRLSEKGKAALVDYSEKLALLIDCLTMCKNIGLCMDILDFETASELLISGTGLRFTPDRINRILEDQINTDRKMNIEFGMDPSQDTLPKRFVQDPLKEGPSQGSVIHIDRMVKEYYRIKGWSEKGIPKK
ncbi:MAG: aldehyde ferredoxin oxidoreductase family protein [Deltaproteobacteria bacterium]|nr:aldehyde ferredoxin oxidoreductase family protein [Deltaproteobacteria bacterium]